MIGFPYISKSKRKHLPAALALLLSSTLFLGMASLPSASAAPVTSLPQVPAGFTVQVFATGLNVPRFLSFSPEGDLYAADMGSGTVAVLPDRNHDGVADSVVSFASGFASPNNVAFHGGSVYVGELGRIWKLSDTNGDLVADTRSVVVDNLPSDGRHRTKTVEFGPDGKLYINVGSYSDDAPEGASRATIWQYNADGTSGKVFSSGLRNTVGFGWDPVGGAMWGVDNGADDLGRNLPPDELNLLVKGGNYGFPYCTGNRQPNPKVPGGNCANTIAPTVTFPAHAAPLGMAFYNASSFPQAYWGGLFVAQHSIQYAEARAIVFVPFKNGKPSGAPQTFSSTGVSWLGLAVDPYDGSLFASQDKTGTIYKISAVSPAPAPSDLSGPAPTAVPGKPAPQPAFVLPGVSRCFSETGKCLRGDFLNYWFTHGGLTQFGLPVTGELTEKLADGKSYTVQYTERARLEYHPENKGKESEVLLGRLGADLAGPRAGEEPFKSVPACGSCNLLYFKQTGHSIGAELQTYWQENGGIPVFGYPLSEAFQERSPTDGKTYLVQYFERNRLEYHPENKGTPYEVLLGLLGVQNYQSRYGTRP
ncbi:MAG: PQQ-dependent sugar dehydrogenase [Chloroflexota bacterium]|nr:PQQ-dependent sugar dehydrogenase [Chloroflexota bacterium]